MNLALSDEQVFLREAARGALSRFKTFEEARAALDSGDGAGGGDAAGGNANGHSNGSGAGGGGALTDLWPTAVEAGWPGLLIDDASGGAGLDAFDAMLVLGECGRVLAAVSLLGHLPATAILGDSPSAGTAFLPALASGESRAAYLAARPSDDLTPSWTVDPSGGMTRAPLPVAVRGGDDGETTVTGKVAFVPGAPGADLFVGVASLDGAPVGFAVEASAAGLSVEPVRRYDSTRSLGHVALDGTAATILDAPVEALAGAWHLAQSLLAAESLGAVETALDTSVAYAKERFTFGRAIGSYQAVKHSLTEVLRQLDNGRSLLYYAGWSRNGAPSEFPLAAGAARSVAGRALDTTARTMISVHGGIGATWEHDAPLYFRRAQLSRRLWGGTALASDQVACELLAQG
jgi:alkylation response protein AidB-like acyl-CoA dehydrogenase